MVLPNRPLCIHRCVSTTACQSRSYTLHPDLRLAIAFIQNVILFVLAVPTQIAALQQPQHLSTSDYVLAALALVDIAAEFVADNQHYSFQTYKRTGMHEMNEWSGARIQWTPADAKRGFITRGLWAWSRHPNFFCEQSFWVRPLTYHILCLRGLIPRYTTDRTQVIMNLFPLLAPEQPRMPKLPLHSITPLWPLVPTITICSLFYSSTKFTESITAAKYPAYAAYQKRVSMFVPFLTPVWGLLLKLQGKKEQVDRLVYGQLDLDGEKKAQ